MCLEIFCTCLSFCKKLRDTFLDVVGNVNLIAVEFDFAAFKFDFALYLREIQDAFQTERIFHVQMDPEERIVIVMECFAVKFLVFLFGAVFGVFQIQRMRVVERLVVLSREIIVNIVRHERAIFFDKAADAPFVEEFFFLLGNVHHDLCAAVCFVALFDRIRAFPVGFPMHALRVRTVRFCENFDVFRNHVRGIKTQPEMPDDPVSARFFILGKKVRRARKSDLRVVLNGQRLCVFVDGDFQAIVFAALIFRRFAHLDEFFKFGNGVYAVRHDLPQKDVFVRIKPLFYDRHHVFAGDLNISLFSHINTSLYKKAPPYGGALIFSYRFCSATFQQWTLRRYRLPTIL